MPGPCSEKNLKSILVIDNIQRRRGRALLSSFEYNHHMDRAIVSIGAYLELIFKALVR